MCVRGEYVLIDQDLAELYEVETRILVRNVKRNRDRFPHDFMFQLTKTEKELENRLTEHDSHFRTVFDAIRQLMEPPARKPRKRIGFRRNGRDG